VVGFIIVDYEWAIKLNRFCLRLIGLWPQNKERRFLELLHATLVLTGIIFVCTVPCFFALFMKCDNLLAYMDSIGYCIPFVITLLKFVIIYNKKKVLLPILNMIADDWAKSKTDIERNVMIRRARIGRAFNIFGYTFSSISLMSMLILPKFGIYLRYTTNGTDLFPLPTYYIYDVSQSPYYEIIFVVQMITILTTISCYLGVDNFFGILILHICGQFENLQTRLANIKESENYDRILTTILLDHTRLISAVDTIEDTYTLLLLMLFLYFGAISCVYGLMLLTVFAGKVHFSALRIFYLLLTFFNTFVQTSLYCIAGQILVSQSEGVHEAAYECEWLNLKSNEAKSLILIMIRAKKPLYLTAGKLFPMTMLTFCNILKISFSYMSFLLTRV
ncbi:odorant receptor 10-like, partial [Ptiloglossa arizonensis]|uniref:odorant receptor 10-like n=1 Tax=Ptiloglossa arizonensis TaxID=3350558 RepID=UPI003FA15ED9